MICILKLSRYKLNAEPFPSFHIHPINTCNRKNIQLCDILPNGKETDSNSPGTNQNARISTLLSSIAIALLQNTLINHKKIRSQQPLQSTLAYKVTQHHPKCQLSTYPQTTHNLRAKNNQPKTLQTHDHPHCISITCPNQTNHFIYKIESTTSIPPNP
ncbi:hypothetical protein KC19_10G160000, partial [Ceratodon purpureus]